MAYQLVDDWLDYAGDAATMGKNVGDDLAEGKLTLPLIRALSHARPEQAELIRAAVAERSTARMSDVLDIVRACGALDYTRDAARREAEAAEACLAALPDTEHRAALRSLARYSVSRLA
jgi:octaprenyl-diphosphate synthase